MIVSATPEMSSVALRYQRNPLAFFTECLDVKPEHVWHKMREVTEAVRDYERVAVKACNSSSKTYTAARLALWFLFCFPPATVVTTAPTWKQVEDLLWREIRDAHTNARVPLGGRLTTTKLNIDPKWYATGFATRPDTITKEATSFQGYHNKNVLVIFDEAAGIHQKIWEAKDKALTIGNVHFLGIGNPTSAYGDFPRCFKPDSGYHQITISVFDTPNYQQDRMVIPGLAGRKYEKDVRERYGEESSFYQANILGEVPTVVSGAVYAKEMTAARREGRIKPQLMNDNTLLVHTMWDLGIGDAMAVWFIRVTTNEIHVINYLEETGQGFTWFAQRLDDLRRDNGWIYGRHFGPHDLAARELSSGNTRLETARRLGIDFEIIERTKLEDGIEAVRQCLPRCYFDESKCEAGLKALCEYHWKRLETVSTDDKPIYARIPEHDASSHGADAFRTGAMALAMGKAAPARPGSSSGRDYHDWQHYYAGRA